VCVPRVEACFACPTRLERENATGGPENLPRVRSRSCFRSRGGAPIRCEGGRRRRSSVTRSTSSRLRFHALQPSHVSRVAEGRRALKPFLVPFLFTKSLQDGRSELTYHVAGRGLVDTLQHNLSVRLKERRLVLGRREGSADPDESCRFILAPPSPRQPAIEGRCPGSGPTPAPAGTWRATAPCPLGARGPWRDS
jgi:hypothetical protein